MAEMLFMAIVVLAGVKTVVGVVFPDIGFERPVSVGFQARGKCRFASWKDVEVDQMLIVARRAVIKFAFRNFLSLTAWYRDSIPVSAKIDDVK